MGYYVRIIDSNVIIKKENLDAAYRAMCALNAAPSSEKHGGKWPKNSARPASSKSLSNDPDAWYSWMDWNYDETCKDAFEILDMLGFWVEETTNGSLSVIGYNDKTGQEGVFFKALAPYIEPGGQIEWLGEDGAMWTWRFEDEPEAQ